MGARRERQWEKKGVSCIGRYIYRPIDKHARLFFMRTQKKVPLPLTGFQPNRRVLRPFLVTNPSGIGQECPRAAKYGCAKFIGRMPRLFSGPILLTSAATPYYNSRIGRLARAQRAFLHWNPF